jgi:RNA polymerase sigma factor (sigma-70 family)
MDYDDSIGRSGLAGDDPLPPEDWSGFARTARLDAIYAAHQPELRRYLASRAPRQDVGDLVQDCFRNLAASKGQALALIEKPGAYLIRTARNLLAMRARTGERRMQSAHDSFDEAAIAGPDPHAALEARDAIRRIEASLARLKPKTREILLMHRFDGLSYEQIAAAKGLTVKGVEWQIAQAMKAIDRARMAKP